MKRLNLTEGEKRKIREKQQSKNLSGWGTRVWNTEYLNKSPLKEGYVTRLNESDVADKMMECQKSNVGNFTPEDEKQFGILFNSIDVMGTNEKAVYGVISKDNYNYFNEALRKKFDERLKCIKGDEFYGIVDFILSDFSGKEKEKVQNMLNSSK